MINLDQFMKSEYPSIYIQECGLKAYVRKGRRIVGDKVLNVLTRANTTNPKRRGGNGDINPRIKRTGLYRQLDDAMYAAALEYGYDGVFVEQVFNPFLPEKLIDMGYTRLEGDQHYCFYKSVK